MENEVVTEEINSLDDLRRVTDEDYVPPVDEEIKEEEVETEPEATEPPKEEDVYEPDFSYRVKDEVKEFDERLRGAITNKEAEDYIRDLVTKAEGLEGYKTKLSTLEEEATGLRSNAEQLVTGYKNLQTLRDNKDYRKLAQALGINEDYLTDWAYSVLEEQELPKEQQALLKENRELEERLQKLERSHNTAESRISEFEEARQNQAYTESVASEIYQLEQTIITDETYNGLSTELKKHGVDFKQEVIKEGHQVYLNTGKEPTIEDAVEMTAKKFGFVMNNIKQETTEAPNPNQRVKHLPSINSANANSVGEAITSLKDLRKLGESLD